MPEADVNAFLGRLAAEHRAAETQSSYAPYRGGEINRLNKGWLPLSWAPDEAIGENWDLITRRILDLQRNDPAIIALENALVDNVIGVGLTTLADVAIGESWDEDFNLEADDDFGYWCDLEADVRVGPQRLSFHGLVRNAFREMLRTGRGLLLECSRPGRDRSVPLCYQALSAEQIDPSRDWPAGGGPSPYKCVRGVEVDRTGDVMAYWLYDSHPQDPRAASTESTRIPASRILDLTPPGSRPGQVHGISLFHAITQYCRDTDNYLGAELTAANIAALFTLVHKTAHPGTGFGFVGDGSDPATADEYGNPKVRLGRGIVSQIGQNDAVEGVQSNRPNPNAAVFIDLLRLMLAMGAGVSKYRMTRDYTGTTYASGRAARLDDQASFAPLQAHVGHTVYFRARRAFTAQAIAYGRIEALSAEQYRAQPARWSRLQLMLPGIAQLDPEKENDADLAGLSGGFETLESVNAKRNRYWRRTILQRKREIEFEKKHLGPLGAALSFERPSQPSRSRQQAAEEADAE